MRVCTLWSVETAEMPCGARFRVLQRTPPVLTRSVWSSDAVQQKDGKRIDNMVALLRETTHVMPKAASGTEASKTHIQSLNM